VNFTDFFLHTYGVWKSCAVPDRRADFKTEDSKYWDCGDKVIRQSDHWGIVGSCFWKIDGLPKRGILFASHCGEIAYADLGTSKTIGKKPYQLPINAEEVEILRAILKHAQTVPEFAVHADTLKRLGRRLPYGEVFSTQTK
jgi:hypothetical protein